MAKAKKFSPAKIIKAGNAIKALWGMDTLYSPIIVEFNKTEWQELEVIIGYDPSTESIRHNRECKETHLRKLLTTDCPTLHAYDYRRGVLSLNPFLDPEGDRLAAINHGHRIRVISNLFRKPENEDATVVVKIELTDSVAEGYDGSQAKWEVKDSMIAQGEDKSAATFAQQCANLLHNRCQGLTVKGSGASGQKYCGRNLLQDQITKLFQEEMLHNYVWQYAYHARSKTGRTLFELVYGDPDKDGFVGSSHALLAAMSISKKEIATWQKQRLDIVLLSLFDYDPSRFDDEPFQEALDMLETRIGKACVLMHAWTSTTKRESDDVYKAWVKLWSHILSDSWPTKGLLAVNAYPSGLADIVEMYRDSIEEQLEEILGPVGK